MAKEKRVVVLVKPRHLRSRGRGTFAVRILELGLTAYGDSMDEALRKVKRMFAATVQAHRECGDLEAWLKCSGLEWYWEDKYEGAVPAEDAKMSGKPVPDARTGAHYEEQSWSDMASETLPVAA